MKSMFYSVLFALCFVHAETSIWSSWFGSGATARGSSRGFLSRERKDVPLDIPDFGDEASVESLNLVQAEATYIKAVGRQDVAKEISAKLEEFASPTSRMADMLGIPEVSQLPTAELVNSSSSMLSIPTELAASEPKERVVLAVAESSTAAKPTEIVEPMEADTKVGVLASWEAQLIDVVASDDEADARPCIAHCRYGEESRHSWSECVERCVKYDLTKRMLLAGLPASDHGAVHLEAETPAGIDELKRAKKRSSRAEEL